MTGSRVLVAMSGGVDSSVAAARLVDEGAEAIGLFMRLGSEPVPGVARPRGCCSARDADDARRVAGRLGIPFYSLDFEEHFGRIIDDFVDEYARARTPNPCIRCNQWLKFGRLLGMAEDLGAESVATGHYVRIDRGSIARARDATKDQSYYLFSLAPEQRARARFPLGELTKDEVRAIARDLGLPTADKPESQDVCFVPGGDYREVVRARRPDALRPGPITDIEGNVLGEHPGVAAFTIGQRRGIGVAFGRPAYVVDLDPSTNTVVVGERAAILRRRLEASNVVWSERPPAGPLPCRAQIRHNHRAAPAIATAGPGRTLTVEFERPVEAVAPGQAVVLYCLADRRVLGGGWIERAD